MDFNSLTKITRKTTRKINIKDVEIGGNAPISVQTMTNTITSNPTSTLNQIETIEKAGADLVRVSCPDQDSTSSLKEIVKFSNIPIIADIHFHYLRAIEAAKAGASCLRINPGNIGSKEKVKDVINAAKDYDCAIRIGVNAGSLEKNILDKYKEPTYEALVESALFHASILQEQDFHRFKISVKASNALLSIAAYSSLSEKIDCPLHVGITEAGSFRAGTVKSSIGIGNLLLNGIGDTIRVSLTEAPEFEMPVAYKLLAHFENYENHKGIEEITQNPLNPFEYQKRISNSVLNIGGKNPPIVNADFSHKKKITPASFFALGYNYSVPLDKWHIADMAADYVFVGDNELKFEVPGTLGVIYNYKSWLRHKKGYPCFSAKEFLNSTEKSKKLNIVRLSPSDFTEKIIHNIKSKKNTVILLETKNKNAISELRRSFIKLINNAIKNPVIINRSYENLSDQQLQISASIDLGALLLDGLGDGVCINAPECGSDQMINSLAFGILQATRTRISKTEYISCPSCGRTLFDLQETTAKIRKVTDHLKGVKIGIMGCIVNGPGEMADADYGYVGTRPGKITLYKEKNIVRKNIDEEEAVDALIDLIKEHGDWVEKPKN